MSTDYVLVKLDSSNYFVVHYQTFTISHDFSVLNIEAQVENNTNEILILSMSMSPDNLQAIALLDYSTSVLSDIDIKQVHPDSLSRSSRFIMHYDYPNEVGYYI